MDWEWEPGGAQIAAIALTLISGAIFLGLLIAWSWRARRVRSGPAGPDVIEVHAAMVRLRGELPDLLHNVTGRLDAKMQMVRELMAEAGDVIAELRRLQATRPGSTHPGLKPPAADPAQVEPPIRQNLDSIDRAAKRSPQFEDMPGDGHELRFERYGHVYSLADTGLDAAAISAETGMHRGEVELVLNLRRKRIRVERGSRTEPARVASPSEEASV